MTAVTAGGAARPPLKITLKTETGEDLEIKLTYGLWNDLQRTIPDSGALIDTILADPFTRDYLIRRCITPLKKIVTDPEKELIPAEDIPVDDPEELDKLLNWVSGHLLYFFAISAGGLKQLAEAFKDKLKVDVAPPAPSTTGSPA